MNMAVLVCFECKASAFSTSIELKFYPSLGSHTMLICLIFNSPTCRCRRLSERPLALHHLLPFRHASRLPCSTLLPQTRTTTPVDYQIGKTTSRTRCGWNYYIHPPRSLNRSIVESPVPSAYAHDAVARLSNQYCPRRFSFLRVLGLRVTGEGADTTTDAMRHLRQGPKATTWAHPRSPSTLASSVERFGAQHSEPLHSY